jgi:catalase
VTFRQDANRIFDFCTLQPSSLHLLTMLMTTRGIPRNYRTMNGFGVNTYRMVNNAGEGILVKYHWRSQQAVEGMTAAEAAQQQGKDLGHASKDLYEAIEGGDLPKWELCVQVLDDGEHPELDFDPLDATKVWPHGQVPLRPIGMMTLDTNVKNFFLENEQIAFGTGVLVDGLDFSDDKLLVGRTFSYSDTQRHRIGPNYLQLPVNRPAVSVHTNQRDGSMAYTNDGDAFNPHVNYEPSQHLGARQAQPAHPDYRPFISGRLVREPIARRDDWKQPGILYTKLSDRDRQDLITNLTNELDACDKAIQERAVAHFARCHPEYGERVADGVGIDLKSLNVEQLTNLG